MKYTLDLLPLRAFQGRGTPVGGRGLRLFGGSDMGGYVNPHDVEAAQEAAYQAYHAPAPEPAPEPAPSWSPPPEAAYSAPAQESAPAYSAPAAPDYTQTVNDIYQQTFGRQADASGMASFTAALNQGMTGEQMRAALASSAEGQSMGLSPAPVAPLTAAAAQAPQWELQPESYDEFTGAYSAPYYRDVISGDRKEVGQPVQATGVTPVDPNTLAQHVGLNFQGTPTQFYDDKGNLKGVLVDAVRAGLGTREGELILDPMSLGLALKPNETASLDSKIQQRNEQGQLLFVDPNTGGTTIYNTGVPAETGSTVKDLLYINERKYGGQIPADMAQGALLLAATMATGGVGGALMNAAGFGGAAAGAAGAGLTATEAAALMGGTLSEAGAAATVGGQLASTGINWGAAATQAAKTAAINAAVTAAQGGNIGQVLKAGALGAVTGGAGVAGADLLGGGALAQIGSQTAIATAMAAATGRDPVQAAISGALTATLANVVPTSTSGILNGAGITDPSIQKAINSAISSSVVAAVRGGDVGTAAIMGAVNSGLTSVAGMIGNSQVVQDIKANITNALTSTIDSVKYEIGATNAQALPIEGSNRSPVGTVLDTQAPYDADAALDKVIQSLPSSASGVEYTPAPPPLVQAAINQNTPTTLADVVTPPLIQQATGQADADAIYNQLVANAANSTVGAPLTSLAGATTSDVNPVSVPGEPLRVNISGVNNKYADLLDSYNTGIATLGYAPVEMDDEDFLDYARKAIEEESAITSAPTTTDNLDNIPVAPTTVVTDGNVPTTAPLGVANSLNPPSNAVRLSEAEARDLGIAPGLYSISAGGQPTPVSTFVPSDNTVPVTPQDVPALRNITDRATQSDTSALVDENGNLIPNAFQNATPEQVDALLNRYINNPESISAVRQDLQPVTQVEVVPPEVQKPEPVQPAPQPPLTPEKVEPEKVKPEEVKPEKTPTPAASSSSSGDTKPAGGLGTQGGAAAGNEGAPGAVSPSGAASFAEAQNIVSEAASNDDLSAEDIIIATQRLVFNSTTLGASPAQAVASGLVTPDGSLTDRGVKRISDATGLSPSDVVELTNGATTARTGTGSGITSTGAGATTGAAAGAALAGTGIGGSTGTNTGGLGTGTGTGVGPGTGTGTGEGSGDGLGLGSGSGSGSGTSGAGTGGVRPTAAPAIAQPSYSYSGAGSQGTTIGALPGNLQATFLQGANVDEYNPFENYNVYQQLGSPAPIRAAEGGSPLQLAQLQQGIAGVDPSLYGVLQKRATPNYFTYGADTSGGNPTTFAGSQLMGKPTPGIPVIPTGKASGSDWLYQGSGTNPLAMAGTGIASLGAGTMAEGGSAHGGGEGEHIPEFITGATGHYVRGRGDGQSDEIPAMLADGEYVFDASTVSTLGNGSSDAGAKLLDAFRESLRDHTRSAPADKIPPKASPLEYMKEALQNVGRK